jgi:uncharacterized protein (TIGR04141 family)
VWGSLERQVRRISGAQAARRLREANDDIARKWTVEFIIADSPRHNGEFNIPFFSKITLRDEISKLKAMGFDVKLRFVRLEPDEV